MGHILPALPITIILVEGKEYQPLLCIAQMSQIRQGVFKNFFNSTKCSQWLKEENPTVRQKPHCQPFPHLLLKPYSNTLAALKLLPMQGDFVRPSLDLFKNVNTHLWVILHSAALEQPSPSILLTFSFLPSLNPKPSFKTQSSRVLRRIKKNKKIKKRIGRVTHD